MPIHIRRLNEEVYDSTDSNETISETHAPFILINSIDKSGIKLGMFVLVKMKIRRLHHQIVRKSFHVLGYAKATPTMKMKLKLLF